MTTSAKIQQIIRNLQLEIHSLENKLSKLPKGNLQINKNGKYFKWYKINNSTQDKIYIKKEDHAYAEALAERKYYTSLYNRKKSEINLLNEFLSKEKDIKEAPSLYLDDNSPYKPLLNSKFNSFSEQLNQWLNAPYEKNKHYPDYLIHKTLSGQLVRSKSEVMIANALFQNKIPYRYEAAICFEDISFYPDFTICHPKTLETIYWEHFGLMDKLQYREKTFNKLKVYGNNGIIPSINLITTYETKNHPLNSFKINQLISERFL